MVHVKCDSHGLCQNCKMIKKYSAIRFLSCNFNLFLPFACKRQFNHNAVRSREGPLLLFRLGYEIVQVHCAFRY